MGDQELVEEALNNEAPACYDGGGGAPHAWMLIDEDVVGVVPTHVGCRDCPATLDLEFLLESYLEHQRIVATGIAVITGELEEARSDLAAASGELLVSMDEMPPGSRCRQLVIANRLMASERDRAREEVCKVRNVLKDLILMFEDGATRPELCARIEATLLR